MKNQIGMNVLKALRDHVAKSETALEDEQLAALIQKESGVDELIESLRWALPQVGHVDVSGKDRDGLHHNISPNCKVCHHFQIAKKVLAKFDGE